MSNTFQMGVYMEQYSIMYTAYDCGGGGGWIQFTWNLFNVFSHNFVKNHSFFC